MAPQKGLGDLERQVMDFLWEHGPATSDIVRAAVSRERPLAESTVRTVLRRLEDKRFVRRQDKDGRYLYSSARDPRRAAADAVRTTLRNFCRGSVEELLAGMVDHRLVGSTELRRIAEKIDAIEKSGNAGERNRKKS